VACLSFNTALFACITKQPKQLTKTDHKCTHHITPKQKQLMADDPDRFENDDEEEDEEEEDLDEGEGEDVAAAAAAAAAGSQGAGGPNGRAV